jgi:hypothetical protein
VANAGLAHRQVETLQVLEGILAAQAVVNHSASSGTEGAFQLDVFRAAERTGQFLGRRFIAQRASKVWNSDAKVP